jgi:transcription antitermination factor NusG
MEQNRIPYPGGFRPGDEVSIVDGTFVGMTGLVISPEAAETLQPPASELSAFRRSGVGVWVKLAIFGRSVAVLLLPSQIRHPGAE